MKRINNRIDLLEKHIELLEWFDKMYFISIVLMFILIFIICAELF